MVWFLLIKGEHLQVSLSSKTEHFKYLSILTVVNQASLICLLGLFAYLAYKTYERKG